MRWNPTATVTGQPAGPSIVEMLAAGCNRDHKRNAILAPLALKWRYCVGMPSIQIKDVPDDVHATLRSRAAVAGKSLQEYLLAWLTDEACAPTLDEVLDRAGGRAGGRAGFKAAARAVRADRNSR